MCGEILSEYCKLGLELYVMFYLIWTTNVGKVTKVGKGLQHGVQWATNRSVNMGSVLRYKN